MTIFPCIERSEIERYLLGMRNDGMTGRQDSLRLTMDTLRRQGPLSQAALARTTGLSKAMINGIVQKLRTQGLVDSVQANGRETIVSLRSRHGVLAAAEVRARDVHVAIFDFDRERRTDVRGTLPDETEGSTDVDMLANVVAEAAASASVDTAGVAALAVAFEGPIMSTGEIASWAWQRLPGWKGLGLAAVIEERFGIPTTADNDANLAALAEWTWGVGRGCDDFLYVGCSAGVGGGVIINGRIYRGGTGLAGEIGHVVIEDAGGICFCGSRGCLSGFVSERAILAALIASDNPKNSLREVVEAARRDDGACQRVLFDAGRHLGKALANVARVTAPSVIAIGGMLGEAADFVFDGLQSSAEIISLRNIAPSLEYRQAKLGCDEVLLGALAAALAKSDRGASELLPWMLASVLTEQHVATEIQKAA